MPKKPIAAIADLPVEKKKELLEKIGVWHNAATNAAQYAAQEVAVRKELAAFFKDATEGTNVLDVGFGKQLKLDVRINRSLDSAQYDALKSRLLAGTNSEDPAHSVRLQELNEVLQKCVTLKPTVVVNGYKALTDAEKLLVADVIKETIGTPGLALHTPA